MVRRSSPEPKAKPMYFSGSSPKFAPPPGAPGPSRKSPASSPFQFHVDLCRRLGEGEERRAEADFQLVALEEAAQELGVDALQVGEADVLVDPQAFDLVEHRRVGGVGVDAVGAAERDHLDRRLVHAGVAHLHRAGVGAQQEGQPVLVLEIDVERVLHRPRWVVLGIVQRSEVVPVRLYFRTVGDLEADRAPDRLDPLPGANHRVDAAAAAAARRQRDVERVLGEPRRELRIGELDAARFERRLDLLLGGVVSGARRFPAFGRDGPRDFWKTESSARKRALAFSSDAGSAAALNSAVARETRLSRASTLA